MLKCFRYFRLILLIIILAAGTGCSLTAAGSVKQSLPARPDAHVYSESSVLVPTAAVLTPEPTMTPTPTPTPLPTPTPTPSEKQIVVSFAEIGRAS